MHNSAEISHFVSILKLIKTLKRLLRWMKLNPLCCDVFDQNCVSIWARLM